MSSSSWLPDFWPVGARAWLYTPPASRAGQLIVLCTWLGAAPKHIAKYTALYQQIAPTARILLITSDVTILTSSYEKQRLQIDPAASAVLSTLDEVDGANPSENSHSKIMLHAFSNGGTNTATQLLLALRQRRAQPLPLVSLVFDSCPAKGTYWKSYTAMMLSLPRGVVTQAFGMVAIHSILILLHAGWIGALGNENPASLQRRTLLDADTVKVEWQNVKDKETGSPRPGRAIYLYSNTDRQVDSTDVRDHAADARKKGLDVLEVPFEGTGHCAHYPKYPDRYAAAASAAWSPEPDALSSVIDAMAAGLHAKEGEWMEEPPRPKL